MLDQVPTSAFLCWLVLSCFNGDDGAGGGVDYDDDNDDDGEENDVDDEKNLFDLLTAQQSGNK